ncbi:TetR/AcrR family transcriptional regulator [Shewanella intestini]|uniref:TetR/AcrR family transcriptional regulator n=1 Tax=Shewanella intestini TaxID=2017544 RepID=A0ABS5I4Z0_9GAMM|nr:MULTISPECIES: TetR/AcrR family transcriptional regulator [Shewanella]MBR9729091.1 TetR/AcrR family transcriptional regulator [Shewanella intestini]MRG37167.1 TetR family transcriptional regulator [Shewanella sp. XMDDZSB0408]
MPTPVKKNRSEQKRQSIIDAAKTTFKEFGVAATSMDKVAEIAQVSKRTVYNHFATKDDLVTHLVSTLWMEALEKQTLVYDPALALAPQLKQLILDEVHFLTCQDNLDIARMAVGYLFYNTGELHKEMARLKQFETALLRWIKAATADGKLNVTEPEFANDQVIHLIKGQCFWSQIIGNQPPLSADKCEQLAQETTKMFLSRYQVA